MADILDLLQTEASTFLKGPTAPRAYGHALSLEDVVKMIVTAVLSHEHDRAAAAAQIRQLAPVSPVECPSKILSPPPPDKACRSEPISISQPDREGVATQENTSAISSIEDQTANPLPELEDLFEPSFFSDATELGVPDLEPPEELRDSTWSSSSHSWAVPAAFNTSFVDPALLTETNPTGAAQSYQPSRSMQEVLASRRRSQRISSASVSKNSPVPSTPCTTRPSRSLSDKDSTILERRQSTVKQKKKNNHRIIEKRYRRRVQTQLERLGAIIAPHELSIAATVGGEPGREDRSSKIRILKDACAYVTILKKNYASLEQRNRGMRDQILKTGEVY